LGKEREKGVPKNAARMKEDVIFAFNFRRLRKRKNKGSEIRSGKRRRMG